MPELTTKIVGIGIPADLARLLKDRAQRSGLRFQAGDSLPVGLQLSPAAVLVTFVAGALSDPLCDRIANWVRAGAMVMVICQDLSLEDRIRLYRLGIDELVDLSAGIPEIVGRMARLARLVPPREDQAASPDVLRGSLHQTSLSDILASAQLEGRTGILSLACGPRRGAVYVREGKVVDAMLEGHEPLDALIRISLWTCGEYQFEPREVRGPDRLKPEALDALAEAKELRDLLWAAGDEIPCPEVPLVAIGGGHEFSELDSEERQLLAELDGRKTLLDLIRGCKQSPQQVIQIVRILRARGFIGEARPSQRIVTASESSDFGTYHLLPALFHWPRESEGGEPEVKRESPVPYRPGLRREEIVQLRRAIEELLRAIGRSGVAGEGESAKDGARSNPWVAGQAEAKG